MSSLLEHVRLRLVHEETLVAAENNDMLEVLADLTASAEIRNRAGVE